MNKTVSSDFLNICVRWLLLALFLLPVLKADAQTQSQSGPRDFVNSIAAPIYKLAWPTATYRQVALQSVDFAEGGYDVSVRLSGNSAFGGGNLWVDLVFLVRNGSLADVKIGADNAILAHAFETLRAAGAVADAYAKQQAAVRAQAVQSAQPAAGAVCLRNATSASLSFIYQWGTGSAQRSTLKAGDVMTFWYPYSSGSQSSPVFSVSYIDAAAGFQQRRYNLDRTATLLPVLCSNVENYSFRGDGSSLILYDVGQSATF